MGEPVEDQSLYSPVTLAWDLATDAWEELEPPPEDLAADSHMTWADGELLVWASRGGSEDYPFTGVLDPEQGWRDLPRGLVDEHDGTGAVWTGSHLFVWGNTGALSEEDHGTPVAGSYDPETDQWEAADPPADGPRYAANAVATGDGTVIYWGGFENGMACTDQCPPRMPIHHAHVFDPADGSWQELPSVPDAIADPRDAWWTGQDVLAAARDGSYLRWDPESGDITRLAQPPQMAGRQFAHVWAGDRLVRYSPPSEHRLGTTLRGDVYDVEADQWEPLPPSPLTANSPGPVVWLDDLACTADCDPRIAFWGGETWQGEDRVRHADGWVLDLGAPAGSPDVPEDFAAGVEVTADGASVDEADLPLTVEVRGPRGEDWAGEVPLDGIAGHDLVVTPSEQLQIVAGPTGGTVGEDEGRLVVAGPHCGWGENPRHPERGITSNCDDELAERAGTPSDAQLAGPDEPLHLEMELLTQDEPFAPVPGAYEVEFPLTWWAPETQLDVDNPDEGPPPEGTATLTVTYTLEAVSEAAAADRVGQVEQREAAEPVDCAPNEVMLSNGDPGSEPGTIQVEVDAFGWFGRASPEARMANVAPPDGEAGARVLDSMLFIDGFPLRDCQDSAHGPRVAAEVVEATDETVRAVATYDELELEVTTAVGPADPQGGPALEQTVELTNTSAADRTVPLVRELSHEYGGAHAYTGWVSDDATALGAVEGDTDVAAIVSGALNGQSVPDRWVGSSPEAQSDPRDDVIADGVISDDGVLEDDESRVSLDHYALFQQWDAHLSPGETVRWETAVVRSTRSVTPSGTPSVACEWHTLAPVNLAEETPEVRMQTLEVPQIERWTPELLESLSEEFRYEVREGNLVVMPAAMRPWHARTQTRLSNLLGGLAYPEQGLVLGEGELRTCDVGVFYEQPPGHRAYHLPEAFSLVVEIVSPSSVREDRQVKPGLYALAGIPEFWLVEEAAEESALVHRYELRLDVYELVESVPLSELEIR